MAKNFFGGCCFRFGRRKGEQCSTEIKEDDTLPKRDDKKKTKCRSKRFFHRKCKNKIDVLQTESEHLRDLVTELEREKEEWKRWELEILSEKESIQVECFLLQNKIIDSTSEIETLWEGQQQILEIYEDTIKRSLRFAKKTKKCINAYEHELSRLQNTSLQSEDSTPSSDPNDMEEGVSLKTRQTDEESIAELLEELISKVELEQREDVLQQPQQHQSRKTVTFCEAVRVKFINDDTSSSDMSSDLDHQEDINDSESGKLYRASLDFHSRHPKFEAFLRDRLEFLQNMFPQKSAQRKETVV